MTMCTQRSLCVISVSNRNYNQVLGVQAHNIIGHLSATLHLKILRYFEDKGQILSTMTFLI